MAQCAPRAQIMAYLEGKYNETVHFQALTNSGTMIEVVMTEDGSTWTVLLSGPRGLSCLMTAGENWRGIKPEPEGGI